MDHKTVIARLLALTDVQLSGFAHHARDVALDPSIPRKDALRVLRRLARLKGGFDLTTLSRIAVQYYSCNRRIVSEIVRDAVNQSNRKAAMLDEVVPALIDALARDPPVRSVASIIAGLSASHSLAARIGASPELLCRLSEYYDATARPEPNKELILARLDLLEGVRNCLRVASATGEDRSIEQLSAVLMAAMEIPHKLAASPRTLVSLSLLADLEAVCHLSDELGKLRDARMDYARSSLASLVPVGQVQSGFELLSGQAKGKGRAVELTNGSLEAALQDILTLLPDRDPAFIRRCLAHPEFAHASTEKLISALLEDQLPAELRAPAFNPRASTFVPGGASRPTTTTLSARANIFDAQPMDESRIRWHKDDRVVDDDAERREFLAATKAAIIARAEAPSSDEEEEDDEEEDAMLRKLIKMEAAKSRGGLRDATLDELDDDEGVLLPAPVRVTESDDDQEDDVPQPRPSSSGFTAAQQFALERAYVTNAATFDKTPAARNSAARKALQAETGLASDLIESWRLMLDRDVRVTSEVQF